MNAITETPRRAVAAPHPTHKFKLLLKREYWEHRGGFFWAPIIASGIFLLLTLMGIVLAEVARMKAADRQIQIDGQTVRVGGVDLSMLTEKLGAEELRHLGGAIDLSLLMSAGIPFLVLGFVVFFYALGSLYDDRKDRSVLFWKSMPLSDTQTVASKLASAVLVAPAIATVAAVVAMVGLLTMLSVFALAHGGNPLQLIWGPASPLSVIGSVAAAIPVYALWALPTVGWLMLCSAAARSKPFLWAVMIPVFLGIFVSWFDVMQLFDLDSEWFWRNVVARSLGSVFPGTWLDVADVSGLDVEGAGGIGQMALLRTVYSVLATPALWIGAAAGLAMAAAAIRLRRWRDEG